MTAHRPPTLRVLPGGKYQKRKPEKTDAPIVEDPEQATEDDVANLCDGLIPALRAAQKGSRVVADELRVPTEYRSWRIRVQRERLQRARTGLDLLLEFIDEQMAVAQ